MAECCLQPQSAARRCSGEAARSDANFRVSARRARLCGLINSCPSAENHTFQPLWQIRDKRGSFVGRLTTEYTETPLATRIWLGKSRPWRKPAHFTAIYKRSEGWLSRAEGLISPTAFRVRMAVSVPSVVQNAVLYNGAANASGLPNIGISVRPFFQCLELQTRGHTLGEQNHRARIKRGDTVAFAI